MPLTKLQFRPGIVQDLTSYSNEGGWRDGDKVRFRLGYPEKIGGWQKYTTATYLGAARALHNWVALDGSDFLGIGTHLKYYVEEGGTLDDITPIRSTTAAGDVTFSAANGSSTLTVSDLNHGAVLGDFVTFSGAVSLGGNITAAVLNQEYEVTAIVNTGSYEVTAKDTSGVTVVAAAGDTGNGGSAVIGAYQINIGLNSQIGGTGWGAGAWSRGGWSSASPGGLTTVTQIRTWSHDNFGEDLLINPRDASIYYWDKSSGSGTRAVNITTLFGSNEAPVIAKQVLVSDRDRHVIAFGCNPQGTNASTDQDPLLIRFSDQEDVVEWEATATTTAGDLRLGSGSTFVQAVETKREILVFTDTALTSMQFIGAPFVFGLQQLASNITIAGSNAAVAAEDFVFWMGIDNFYVYAGQTQQLPCTVKDYVFSDFNVSQSDKVYASINSEYGEVIWFYPSAASSENDRYVMYNYAEKVWYYGNMARTAWLDRGVRPYPIATESGYLYNHEFGYDDDGSPMDSFVESSVIDIEDGDKFVMVKRVIPDLTFVGSTAISSPQATFTIKARDFPGAPFNSTSSGTAFRTAVLPVQEYTDQLHVRARGRSFALRVDSSALGTKWRLGSPRVEIRPDGRR